MNGIVNIYKSPGMTSHDVVYKVRRISGIKKVGHTGTLDPDAEGVLPICLGKATKASDMMTFSDKRYTAILKLGVVTDTQDSSGEIIEQKEVNVSENVIRKAVEEFAGEIMQIPPMYSAIKVNGKKLYELARAGVEIERKPRKITVYEINILNINNDKVELDIKCSKGTYIRTLCHDIGSKLGCGGCMEKLIRTQTSIFTVDRAVTLEELEKQGITKFLLPVDDMFDYDKLYVYGEDERKTVNGNSVKLDGIKEDKFYKVYGSDGRFLCISKGLNGNLTLVKSFY